jgi:LysR family cys regulon transcriptional activator
MKLPSLLFLCVIEEQGFNLSRAARALHTSQPGVSRYVRLAEEEVGVPLFVRDRKRIVGLTPAGTALVAVAKRVRSEMESIDRISTDFKAGNAGDLTVATAHTHARYTLPPVIERFIKRYPNVRLRLRQGYSSQIVSWVKSGEADIFIATAPSEPVADLSLLPCHELHRVILTPPHHPLLKKRRVDLADVCAYPIITYDREFAARAQIVRAFHARRLDPNIVLSATDADVMKTYVKTGLGIAIVAHTAFDRHKDPGLKMIDARHLFESSTVHIGLKRSSYLSNHMVHFIELFAPRISRAQIDEAVNGSSA